MTISFRVTTLSLVSAPTPVSLYEPNKDISVIHSIPILLDKYSRYIQLCYNCKSKNNSMIILS